MNLPTIQAELIALFAASHRFAHDGRRLIFWYDADQQFQDVFAALVLPGVHKRLHDGAWFGLKHELHRGLRNDHVLVYAPFAEPAARDNYLYDLQVTGLCFGANRANMVFSRLGLQQKSLEAYLQDHSAFLQPARVEALLELAVPAAADEGVLRCAMLCVLAKVPVLDAGRFVRKLFKAGILESENGLWQECLKFFSPSELWAAIAGATGYGGAEEPNLAKLFNSLAVTHLRRRWAQGFPKSLEHFVLQPDMLAVQLVQTWLDDSKDAGDYKRLAAITEHNLGIADLARDAGAEALRDADSFAAIEQAVLRDCVQALQERRIEDARRWIDSRTRSGWHWELEYGTWYEALGAAARMLGLNWQELPNETGALWALYADRLHLVDRAYREFCAAFAPLESKGAELLKPLSDFIERVYIEDYLERLGQAWSDALGAQAELFAPFGIATQQTFFDQVVQPALEKSRVAVVISDALRFETGVALLESLKLEDNLEVTLATRITGLPSVTKTGMAALLPGSKLELNANGVVLRDGQATNTTEARESILKAFVPSARAIQEDDLTRQKRDQLRPWVQKCDLLYVYHNIIDTTGESAALELDVPEAAKKTLLELSNLVKRLLNLNVTQVFVTADHGFLFQRRKLEEYEKLNANKSGELIDLSKRYALGKGLSAETGAQKFAAILDGLEVVVPRGSLRFVSPGRGTQYVHGGSSLQETMIPVLSVRASRGKSVQAAKVDVILQHSGTKRITGNPFTITLAQLEPVSEARGGRRVRVGWFDASNAPVTEELRLNFDSGAAGASERVQKKMVNLTLNAPDRFADYTLIVRDADDDSELLRETWRIDLAIPDDFGI